MDDIKVQVSSNLKKKPARDTPLGFGKLFTDYMFLMEYSKEKGWHNARIEPYGPLSLDPATNSLHYGQLMFEGMKAYRTPDGRAVMFRPDKNMIRINNSGHRICIPPIDEAFTLKAIAKLVDLEKDWIPEAPGTSLYIRPFILSTDPVLGVAPSNTYLFCVILSPVGSYYPGGLKPTRIHVETEYVRAVRGGTGYSKCAGNYASSLLAQKGAAEHGFDQVLWLDGVERKYVEEVGAMNVFFVLDGKAVTADLGGGTILPGITRMSVLELLKSWGFPTEERKLSIQELADAYDAGKFSEAFGTGTAAVIAPIGELGWAGKSMKLSGGNIGPIAQRLYDEITGIQTGRLPDKFGWVYEVK